MRLISLTVRNYRIHGEMTVDFDSSRNLIGGPNETGKSTLAEAIHRALFMRYKAGGDLQKSMVSDMHAGHPEVKLTFEAAGDTWTIEKLFAGSTKSTARLTSLGGISLQGDPAEEKLAEITSNPDGMANRENDLATRWAHLWVWQGTSGADASTHAANHRDELIQRLQANGLATVMQSEADEKTREKMRAMHESIFTKNGLKTGSRLDLAIKALAEAQSKLEYATEQKARLEKAIAEQESAVSELASSEAALPALREQCTASKTSLAKARELRTQLEKQTLIHSQATATLLDKTNADQQIRSLHSEAAVARKALVPAEQKLTVLAEQSTTAAANADEARIAAGAVADDLRLARQHHDLANACSNRFEKASVHDAVDAKAKDIAAIEQSLTADRESLSRLPAISPEQLESLRTLESQHAQARSALEAIATGLELIASPQAVLLDNQPLEVATPRIITETSEVSLPDGTRLRIQPGGGTSLAKSRRKVDDLEKEIATLLDQLAITDSKQAAEIVAQRQFLEQKISTTLSRLKDLGARNLPEALSNAKSALTAATAEIERRLAALPSAQALELPQSLAAAQDWQTQARESLEAAEQREQTLRANFEATHKAHQVKLAAYQTAQKTLETRHREIADMEASIRTLEKSNGDAPARAESIASATREEAAIKSLLEAVTAALADLNPERLEQEVVRLERVINNELEKQQSARERLAVAKTTLASDGTSDPQADLLQAKARHAAASDEHAREKRHATAIDLLHQLFTKSQESITRSITQPIADRVCGYLECIYGRGVRVDVDWTDSGTSNTIRITRPGTPQFAFGTLSGGAREQVAAAVRLATAEILATAHNGCLPILFDDSFAYSDKDRIQSLQSMLELAANRGLQVLVLSCTPSDYIGLGAKETFLKTLRRIDPLGQSSIELSS
jgi:DNA repair exonuclease SbcCD ATPase subunit